MDDYKGGTFWVEPDSDDSGEDPFVPYVWEDFTGNVKPGMTAKEEHIITTLEMYRVLQLNRERNDARRKRREARKALRAAEATK